MSNIGFKGVIGTYFVSMLHLVGSGLLAQTITSALHGTNESTWITLTLIIIPATLGPAISLAADFWGRKYLITAVTIMGFVGTIVVARAQSLGAVIAGQTIAGFGQTSQALTHAVVSEIMPRKYRAHAQTSIQLSVGLSAVTALYVGGAMCRTNPDGFRNFFYLAAGLFICSAAIVAFLYKPPTRELQRLTAMEKIRRFDIGGTVLTVIAFMTICMGLGWSQNPYSWKSAHVLAPFLVGICSLLALIVYAARFKTDGIWHREFFHSRNFIVAETCIFVEGFLFLAFNNYVPYQISFLYGKDLFDTALEYSVAFYVVPIGALVSGFYATKTRKLRLPLIFSFVLMGAFFGAMASTNLSSGNKLYGLVVLFGVGLGIAIPVMVTIVQLSVPPQLIATVTGLMLATRATGGTVGLAVYNAILNAAVASNLAPKVSAAAIPLGLPPSSLGQLLGALTSNNQQAMQQIPGITPQIIGASVVAMKEAFRIGFRNVYIMSASMTAVGIAGKFILFSSLSISETASDSNHSFIVLQEPKEPIHG